MSEISDRFQTKLTSVEAKFHQGYKTILLNNFGVVYILQEIVPTSIYRKWEKGERMKK